MPDVSSTSGDKVRSFWDRYVRKLHESGIKPPFYRWFVVRAEQYIEAHPNRKLAEQEPSDVYAYLAEAGRWGGLKDWQFRQIVDAIQKLFELAGVAWLAQVDWDHWRDSAQSLEPSHPTVARDYGENPAKTRITDSATYVEIKKAHAGMLDQVKTAVRRRGYSIKTEQTYLHWIMRFIDFLGNADPSRQGPEHVGRFLDDLAISRKVSASTQNLALNALVFLYRETLGREDLNIGDFARAKRPRRLPTVLTHGEVAVGAAAAAIRYPTLDGRVDVWNRNAPYGMLAAACFGH